MHNLFNAIVVSFMLLAGLGSTSTFAGEEPELIICTEPRPEVCTMDYRPVCGRHSDGSYQTYSNGCMACSNPLVEGYIEDACEE